MAFEGSCHCGQVRFTVEADQPAEAFSCNCSICRRKGLLLAFFPAEAVRIERGEEHLRSYRFNTGKIEHRFCETCGTQTFAAGAKPDGTAMQAINLRCVPALDLDGLQIRPVNGAAL